MTATLVTARPTVCRPELRTAHQVAPQPMAAAPERTLRLTRRGRVLLLALLAVAVLAAFSMGRASGSAGASSGPATPRSVVVAPGDTLWSVARAAAPGVDPRVEVPLLKKANGLSGAGLQVGQRLVVPDPNG